MAQVTGIVKIHVNGALQRSKEGATLNMGGMERAAQTGHSVYGYSEKLVPASVSFNLAHTADTDLIELNGMVGAEVRFECDTGVTYLITNAFVTKPCQLKGGDGDVTVEMMGDPAIEE
jgi:hypothetical protein